MERLDPHRSVRRIATVLLALVATLSVIVGAGSPAAGGGWAVGSLDALPDARAGQTEQVGFTVLQHGVTPRHLEQEAGDVGIEIVRADGEVDFFPADATSRTGHYVATVTFPSEGTHTWGIRMGWFPLQDLGAVTVVGADTSASSGSAIWNVARWAVLGLAVALAAVACGDRLRSRRRIATT